MDFKDRTVLVTGATRGIGRSLAEQLVEAGASVIALARDETALADLSNAYPGKVIPIAADLADPSAPKTVIAQLKARHPDVSLVINNAALQTEMDFTGEDPVAWLSEMQREVSLNLGAAMALSTGCLPILALHPDAVVVNVGSALALAPKKASPVYCATKAGLRNFSKALSYQCRERLPHVRIVHVVMALVDTDMTMGRGSGKISPDAAARRILNGLERNETEIWVGKAALLKWIQRISPGLAARILK